MATFRVPMLGPETRPDNTGFVFQEPFSIKAVNDRWDYNVFVFTNSGVKMVIHTSFPTPPNYVSNPFIFVQWTSSITVGDVVWDIELRNVAAGESLDQSGVGASSSLVDGPPSAAFELQEALLAPVATTFGANKRIQFDVGRDGLNASDTHGAAVTVHGVIFQYDDV